MNSSFHAFQLSGMPDLSPNRKHIRLKKSMSLPDDTLEYWGFYLLKGSTVVLSVCSRFVLCLCQIIYIFTLDQACSAFYVMSATSAKFGLLVGNMKFNRQNKE
jgi:hypothetical protein